MTIEELRESGLIVYECISGSKAYGLSRPSSDTDIKGVFVLPRHRFYGLTYVPQVADATNDTVFYELGRYVELLLANNPNLLELLATPPQHVLRKHPLIKCLTPELFLSKKCRDTFGGYALTQVRKASGLNKRINVPEPRERRTLPDFCYVLEGQGSRKLSDWLGERAWRQDALGLINVPSAKGMYAVYYDPEGTRGYRGVVRDAKTANQVALSSIPKGEAFVAHLYVNVDGYRAHCKAHARYWSWVEARNDARYAETVAHDRGYDAKNLMHTFRLLDMAKEILGTGKVIVERPNREELLAIRRGEFAYEDLMARAEAKMRDVEAAWRASALPESPSADDVEKLLVELREEFYGSECFT